MIQLNTSSNNLKSNIKFKLKTIRFNWDSIIDNISINVRKNAQDNVVVIYTIFGIRNQINHYLTKHTKEI
jgi:hypothetical protein